MVYWYRIILRQIENICCFRTRVRCNLHNHCAHCAIRFEKINIQCNCSFLFSSSKISESVSPCIAQKLSSYLPKPTPHIKKKTKVVAYVYMFTIRQKQDINGDLPPGAYLHSHFSQVKVHSSHPPQMTQNVHAFSHQHPYGGAFSLLF